MKQITIFLLLSLASCSTSSSIKNFETGGDWSGFRYTHFCPEYSFSEDGKMAKSLDILGNNHISLASPDCHIAIDKAKDYIKQYYGVVFLDKSEFQDIDIVYLDSIAAFERRGNKPDLKKCGDTKYFARFLFKQADDVQYRFGIAMNKEFEIISPTEFLNFDQHPEHLAIIGPREAHKIALKKHRMLIRKTEEIVLVFDKENNRFIWEIKGETIYKKNRSPKSTKKSVKYGFVQMDAVTGNILHAEMMKSHVMVNPRYF